MYLNSDDIRVFPYGQERKDFDPAGRLLNEQNITKLVKSISDKPSYIISYDTDTNIIDFVIQGYHITAHIKDILNSEEELWAGVCIVDEDKDKSEYSYLAGTDTKITVGDTTVYEFQGVGFGSSKEAIKGNSEQKFDFLQLFDKEQNLHAESLIRFNPDTLGVANLLQGLKQISGRTASSCTTTEE